MTKTFVFALVSVLLLSSCSMSKPKSTLTKHANLPIYHPMIDGRWVGIGISYGSYRDGESPKNGDVSSEEDILEDMLILTEKGEISWNSIRIYGADAASEQVLKVINRHNLPVKVMQGAWLGTDQTPEENEEQITEVIRLANEYPNIVVAVNLGNEIFVDWSAHKFEPQGEDLEMYLGWVERVKAAVDVPVTLADDYNFWNKEWSKPVADALDFMVLHAYAMWNSQELENAVQWTADVYDDIQSHHPNKLIVLGESGWATSSVSTNSDERLIIGEASESAQAKFYEEYNQWLLENQINSFYFEAFDENWKGGEDKPKAIAEKNWGLFNSDRTPKAAMKKYFSDM